MKNFDTSEYIGQKVLVNKTSKIYKGKTYSRFELNPAEAFLDLIFLKAKKAGYDTSRIWFSNTIGARDYKQNRINIRISEMKDGTFEITDIYFG